MKKLIKFLIPILFILFSDTLNAQVNNSFTIDYDYNSNYVVNNNNSVFFGENGYLEQLRSMLEVQYGDSVTYPYSYLLGFTKDDIYIILDSNKNSEFFFNIGVKNNNQSIVFYSRDIPNLPIYGTSKYYFKLSDYNSFDSFYQDLLNHYQTYYEIVNINNPIVINSDFTITDLRNSSFDYFLNSINNYFIPYYSNRNLKSDCFSNLCSNNSYVFEKVNVNGNEGLIPLYFDLFGYDRPNVLTNPKVSFFYKFFNIIKPNAFNDEFSVRYSFTSNSVANISRVDIYGIVNDNGLKHYEKINSSDMYFDLSNQYNFLSCTGESCVISYSSDSIVSNIDLFTYEAYYLDFVFSEPVNYFRNTINSNVSSAYINVGINDISFKSLFLQLETTSFLTYVFSSKSVSSSTELFYSNVLQNDVLYNQGNFIDLSNQGLLQDIQLSQKNSYYGVFNRVLFDNYSIGNNTGFVVNLYSYNPNDLDNFNNNWLPAGAFQIMYFISPNLYWADSVYNEDRNSMDYYYIDNNGNKQSGKVYGDFSNQFNYYTQIDNSLINFKNSLGLERIGITEVLTTPFIMLKDVINNSLSSGGACNSIIVPIPFTNKTFSLPCMSSIYYQYIPNVITIWHTVLWGVVVFGLALSFIKSVLQALDPSEDVITGVDWIIHKK